MDFRLAKQIFTDYLQQYDTSDDKIRLKIVHTYGVVAASEYICSELSLSRTNFELARHIALLHDIGRFEQLRLYHSFDDAIMPHAQCSLNILFDNKMIEQFIPERSYDEIIYDAIKNHGVYKLDTGLTGQSLLHAKIIRDADKLDNFRVKEVSDMTTLLDVTEEELAKEKISDKIYQDFMEGKPILNSERKTRMDMWVSYLGYIFDLNFSASVQYLAKRNSVNKLVDRIAYSDMETKKRMEEIRNKLLNFQV